MKHACKLKLQELSCTSHGSYLQPDQQYQKVETESTQVEERCDEAPDLSQKEIILSTNQDCSTEGSTGNNTGPSVCTCSFNIRGQLRYIVYGLMILKLTKAVSPRQAVAKYRVTGG